MINPVRAIPSTASPKDQLQQQIDAGFNSYLQMTNSQVNNATASAKFADFLKSNHAYMNLLNEYTNLTRAENLAKFASIKEIPAVSTNGSVYKIAYASVNGTSVKVAYSDGLLADGEHFTRVKVCGMNDTDPWIYIIDTPYQINWGPIHINYGEDQNVGIVFDYSDGNTFAQKMQYWASVNVDYYNFFVGVMSFGLGVQMPDFGTFIGAFGIGQGGAATVSNFNEFVNDVPQYVNSYWGLWLDLDNSKLAPWISGLDAQDGGGGLSSQDWYVRNWNQNNGPFVLLPLTDPLWGSFVDSDAVAAQLADAIHTLANTYHYNTWAAIPLDSPNKLIDPSSVAVTVQGVDDYTSSDIYWEAQSCEPVYIDGQYIGSLGFSESLTTYVDPCSTHTISVGGWIQTSTEYYIQLEDGSWTLGYNYATFDHFEYVSYYADASNPSTFTTPSGDLDIIVHYDGGQIGYW